MHLARRVHYATPDAEIEKYLAACRRRGHARSATESRRFPAGAVSVWRLSIERANILQMAPQCSVALRIRRRPLPELHG